MAIKLTLSLSKVLADNFTKQQRIALAPLIRSPQIKNEFAQRCIDRIIERTNSGIDKRGDTFAGYSSAYKKSRRFAIYGKSSQVDLKLTGAMQASIGLLSTDNTSVTIGIDGGLEEDKARGHIKGANYLPVRDFWGLPEEDQAAILKDVVSIQNAEESLSVLQDLLGVVAASAILAGGADTNTSELSNADLAILSELEDQ